MSFDVNPLGPRMHLNQLEREARSHHRFEAAAEGPCEDRRSILPRAVDWIARFAALFATPRQAS